MTLPFKVLTTQVLSSPVGSWALLPGQTFDFFCPSPHTVERKSNIPCVMFHHAQPIMHVSAFAAFLPCARHHPNHRNRDTNKIFQGREGTVCLWTRLWKPITYKNDRCFQMAEYRICTCRHRHTAKTEAGRACRAVEGVLSGREQAGPGLWQWQGDRLEAMQGLGWSNVQP